MSSARDSTRAKNTAPKSVSKPKAAKSAPKSEAVAPLFYRRLLKWASVFIAGLVVLPILVSLIYAISSVRPISTLMAYQWVTGKNVTRAWVPLEDISPYVMQSVLMSEDGRYCFHSGVDWAAVNLVIDDAIEGEPVRGASTIPMQSVKNLYLWSNRSYVRKALEIPLALMVDAIWGKKRLLEIYLNIAEWGPGIFGIEAASRHHYKRSASRLTRRQAAYLAVTLPNPILRNPRKPNRGMRRLARVIERRAKASGAYIGCLK